MPEIVPQTPSNAEQVIENKQAAMSLENSKKKFIKEMVFTHGPLWWENLKRDLTLDPVTNLPKDKDAYRSAMIEFNKLQARVLPTEITGADGEQLVLNVVQWVKEKEDKYIDAPSYAINEKGKEDNESNEE